MLPIHTVAERLGLTPSDLISYGTLAKLNWDSISRLSKKPSAGRLVLVSAMTPTKYGEGKTTSSIGLVQGLNRIGIRSAGALREPSLGPVFGAKGGGTGGGKTCVEPSERVNLHCTGDMHAIASANNLLAALVDNAVNFDQLPIRTTLWRRCIDMNDRFLRNTVIGLGGSANGVPREDGFDITAASQVMATLCMADDLADLKRRLGRLIVGIGRKGEAIVASELKSIGSLAALLAEAMLPNLAQTSDGSPVFIHGGPFANIAHGCSSVIATRSALKLADVVVTEGGFAFDLGGEKFLNLKCRSAGLWPSAVVVVATVRALRFHGGDEAGQNSIRRGFANLARHLKSVQTFGLTPVVALNVFADDKEEDLSLIEGMVKDAGVAIARNEGYGNGSEGSVALAKAVSEVLKSPAPAPKFLYALDDSFETKVQKIATQIYGASHVELTADAKKDLERCRNWGLGQLPVCVAKTHLSLTDDPTRQGAPSDFSITIRQVRPSAGAGFLLALTGEILTMPGLPRVPAAYGLDVTDDGQIVGLRA